MKIAFLDRISVRLTRYAVLIAFCLGILSSLVQVMIDFQSQRSLIQQVANEIHSVFKDSATKIVYQLDDTYALELIQGLQNYQVLQGAKLLDDRQTALASFSLQSNHEGLEFAILAHFIPQTSLFQYPLLSQRGETIGHLELVTNNYQAMRPFFSRAVNILWTGLVKNTLLAAALILVFHYVVARPLTQLAYRLKTHPVDNLPSLPRHKHSEIGIIIDNLNKYIAENQRFQVELSELANQKRLILDTAPQLILAVDKQNNIIFANSRYAQFIGLHAKDVIKKNILHLHAHLNSHSIHVLKSSIEHVFANHAEQFIREITLYHSPNNNHTFECQILPFNQFDSDAVLIIFNDISERIESQKAIQQLAYYDTLTGLYNRTAFIEHLQHDMQVTMDQHAFGALLFVDLSKFKLINDTLGYEVGDSVLLDVANNINQVSQSASVARMGGDEFALSLPRLSVDSSNAQEQACRIARKINNRLKNETIIAGQSFPIEANVGVVVYPQQGSNAEHLIQYAGTAMYRAKQQDNERIVVFEQALLDKASHQMKIEGELINAVKLQEFRIALQPIYSANGVLRGAEALIRWQHPEQGLLSPYYFLEYMEGLNLTHHLTSQAIKSCGQVWPELCQNHNVDKAFRFSINISTLEFYRSDFIEQLTTQIAATDLPVTLFELEITEGIALHDLRVANDKIRALRQQGITVSIDDFGTGFSSLSYLKQLPFDKLKIDKSFINDIEMDVQDQRLVDSIINIAKNFGLDIVVEGVESSAQLNWLTRYDSLLYQGYYFSKPVLSDQFCSVLKEISPSVMSTLQE